LNRKVASETRLAVAELAHRPSASRPMPAESTNRRYVVLLAIAAALVLILGIWARPKKSNDESSPPVTSPAELVRLEQLTQRRTVQNMAAYFSDVAANAARHLVYLTDAGLSGICWDGDGTLITAAVRGGFPAASRVRTSQQTEIGGEAEAQTAVVSPVTPVVSLRVIASSVFQPVHWIRSDLLVPGDWLVAVARQADGRSSFAPGIYGGLAASSCGEFEFPEITWNISLGEGMLGGGLFDLDGNLVAMVIRCGDRYAAMAADRISGAIQEAHSLDSQLLERYGFRIERGTEGSDEGSSGSAETLAAGVQVTEVWTGDVADRAGMLPGDFIVSLDGKEVASGDDLLPLVLPVARELIEIGVRRGSGSRSFELSVRGRPLTSAEDASSGGLSFQGAGNGFVIESVADGSPAQQAGLHTSDRVLLINGRTARNVAALLQALAGRGERTVSVIAERDDRKRLFVLDGRAGK